MIEHGVDTGLFCPGSSNPASRKNACLSVVNDWINRDVFCGFKLWQEIISGFPYHVLGTTPGLSSPAKDVKDLARNYREHSIFVNTSQISPIPSSMLEAAASGAAIVSTSTCAIPEIFTDGYDAFLSNDVSILRKRIEELLASPERAREMGLRARQTILDRFSMDRFVNDWNCLFNRVTK